MELSHIYYHGGIMPGPIHDGAYHYKLRDLFTSRPESTEEIRAEAEDCLERMGEARKNEKKIAVGEHALARIAKFGTAEDAKTIAAKTGNLIARFSSLAGARIALCEAALTVLSNPLGASLAQNFAAVAAEGLKRCQDPSVQKEIVETFGHEISSCASDTVTENFISYIEALSSGQSDEKKSAGYEGGFRALTMGPQKSLESLLLEAAKASLQTAPAAGRDSASSYYIEAISTLLNNSGGVHTVTPQAAPALLPVPAGPLSAPVGDMISLISKSSIQSFDESKPGREASRAFFELLSQASGDPAIKVLTSTASKVIATDPINDSAASVVKDVVMQVLVNGAGDKPEEALLKTVKDIIEKTSVSESSVMALRIFFQEMEGVYKGKEAQSLIKAAMSSGGADAKLIQGECAAFRAVAETLGNNEGNSETLLAAAALQAQEYLEKASGRDLSTYGAQVKVAESFMKEIAQCGSTPTVRAIAQAVSKTSGSQKGNTFSWGPQGSVSVCACKETFQAIKKGLDGSIEDSLTGLLERMASEFPPDEYKMNGARVFIEAIRDNTGDEATKHIASALLTITDCRRCSISSEPGLFPNCDFYSFQAFAEYLHHRPANLSVEKTLADMSLRCLNFYENKKEYDYKRYGDLILKPFMKEIAGSTGDARLSDLLASLEKLSSLPKPYGAADANDVYAEAMSMISGGIKGEPGEEYALLVKKAAGSTLSYEHRMKVTETLMKKCVEMSKNESLTSLLSLTAVIPAETLYDTWTFMYAAAADWLLSAPHGAPSEKDSIAIALKAVSQWDQAYAQGDYVERGKAETACAVLQVIEGTTKDNDIKAVAATALKAPEYLEEHTHTQSYHTGSGKYRKQRTREVKDAPRHGGIAACGSAALKVIQNASGEPAEKLMALAAREGMAAAGNSEDSAVAARPFIDAISENISSPYEKALFDAVKALPEKHHYDSEIAMYREGLDAMETGPSPDTFSCAQYAARALHVIDSLQPVCRAEVMGAYLSWLEELQTALNNMQSLVPRSTKVQGMLDKDQNEILVSLTRMAKTMRHSLPAYERAARNALSFAAKPLPVEVSHPAFLASMALEAKNASPPMNNFDLLMLYDACLKEIAPLINTQEIEKMLNNLNFRRESTDTILALYEKTLKDIVDTYKSLAQKPVDNRIMEIEHDGEVLNIGGVRLRKKKQ